MCGKDDSSDEMLAMQKEEAAEARTKDEERRARIDKAVKEVQEIYKGKEIMAPTTAAYDWSTFVAPASGSELAFGGSPEAQGVPEGYTYGTKNVTTGGTAGTKSAGKVMSDPNGDGYIVTDANGQNSQRYDSYSEASAAAQGMTGGTSGGTTTQKGFYDAAGNFYPEGTAFDVTTQTGTGKFEGGFGDEFYNDYRNAMTGYYLPQVQDKYKEASDETTYALARAGTLNSSAAIDEVAELLKQKEDQEAKVYMAADQAVGEKKSEISQEMANAINMVNSVEDPEVAVSTALDRAENITSEPVDLSPLGDIFKVATIGAAKYYEGAQAKKTRDAFGTQPGGYYVTT
jgi:hypothetical protein